MNMKNKDKRLSNNLSVNKVNLRSPAKVDFPVRELPFDQVKLASSLLSEYFVDQGKEIKGKDVDLFRQIIYSYSMGDASIVVKNGKVVDVKNKLDNTPFFHDISNYTCSV